ncbi:MAG: bifunctional alpha/beta hydrolase/OsmC family protein [Ginsengibacter sp.]
MNILKVSFKNKNGQNLSGRLELPKNRRAHNFALFAHCFTCNKNLNAIRNISRSLTLAGFGVLRFDFTGLGESEGDFENTNFSGNVEDLVMAATWLEENYSAPTILIGHSLGGAAVIYASAQLSYVKAVAVINSPADPAHVKHLLKNNKQEIEEKGEATVHLEGRDFTIKKQFLDDLENKPLSKIVNSFKKAFLILHSPQDTTVFIDNAEKLYHAARHPKSFISLDGADHLLSDNVDSQYAGNVIAGWATRYVEIPKPDEPTSTSEVAASLDSEEKFTTHLKLGDHFFIADEPTSFGGNNFGPSPYQFFSASLAACTAMTIQMYARRKNWEVTNVTVHINHGKEYAIDCENCEDDSAKIDTLHKEISFEGTLSEEQINRLLEIADRCPVHKTMTSQTQIISKLVKRI